MEMADDGEAKETELVDAVLARLERDVVPTQPPEDQVRLRSRFNVRRFLDSRDWNVDRCVRAMEAWVEWRRTYGGVGIDHIAPDSVAAEELLGKGFLHGTSLAGQPVVFVRPRFHDPSNYDAAQLERYVLFLAAAVERVLVGDVRGVTVVFDMIDFGLGNMDYDLLRSLLDLMGRYFPGLLGLCLVIDSPLIFWACWQIIESWLPKRISSTVKFVAVDELKDYISRDQLMKEYGGDDPFVHPSDLLPEGDAAAAPAADAEATDGGGGGGGWFW